MKLVNGVIAAGLLTAITTVNAETNFRDPEFRFGMNMDFPGSTENWDTGIGLHSQATFWQENGVGLAVSFGTSSWDVIDSLESVSGNATTARMTGDASYHQLGLSLVKKFKIPDVEPNDRVEFRAELGLRYTFVSSDANLEFGYADNSSQSSHLNVDNGTVAVIAADMEYKLDNKMKVFGGIGYQLHLVPSEAEAFTGVNENVMNAVFIRSGVSMTF